MIPGVPSRAAVRISSTLPSALVTNGSSLRISTHSIKAEDSVSSTISLIIADVSM